MEATEVHVTNDVQSAKKKNKTSDNWKTCANRSDTTDAQIEKDVGND